MITTITLQRKAENQLKTMAICGANGIARTADEVTAEELKLIIKKAVGKYCNDWQTALTAKNKTVVKAIKKVGNIL